MAFGVTAGRGHEPNGRVRVIHIITELRVGGAELQLERLVNTPSASGDIHLVGVICLGAGGAVADSMEASGIRVWRLGAVGVGSLLRSIVELRRILRTERVTVAIAWLYHAMIATALPGVAPSDCAVVWNVRGTLPTRRDKRSTRMVVQLSRALAWRPERIVFNAASARAEHERAGYPHRRGLVIPNGYPAARAGSLAAWDADGGAQVILLAARFHPMKDFPTFLRALQSLREDGVPFRARLVGEGCEASNPALRRLLDESGNGGVVELGGTVRDMDEEYRRASIVCSSSAWGEGFHNVLAEASLQGAIVVSTDVGDARLLVTDPGLLVAPGDPRALARALRRALELSFGDAQARREAQRELVMREYSTERMRERYDALSLAVAGEGVSS